MSEWSLPTLTLNPLAAFGILLIVGVLGGQIARRVVHLPAITGYVLAGLIISPAGLALIDAEMLHSANLFLQLAQGLALFEIGRRIDLTWLRRERILLVLSLNEWTLLAAGSFWLGFGLLAAGQWRRPWRRSA